MSEPPAESPAPGRQAVIAGLAVVLYLLLCSYDIEQVLRLNNGHFAYALDDPYIHLALSEGIAHGHYGINPGEYASPSSSIVWPYLLAAFARFPRQPYVPLALNLLAGIAATLLASSCVARWPAPPVGESPSAENLRRAVSTVALIFIGNLVGLTLIGMEHTLQVFLAGAGAWVIIACLRGRTVPRWALVCVAFAPLVRYENAAISVACAVALVGHRRARDAFLLLLASFAPLAVFSFYLHHLGLPWLPTSVLVKGQIADARSDAGMLARFGRFATNDLGALFTDPQRLPLIVLFATLAGLTWAEPRRDRRFAFAGATAAAGLHLAIGRFNWFHRYEVYAVFFSALVVLHALHERPRALLGWYALGLLGCSYVYLRAFYEAPLSASQVYRQQYQMHRFETEFYTGNVAVNDLGLVSYRRRPQTYVLDLWGLGSISAARQIHKSTEWLDRTIQRHDIGLVMYYPLWFDPPPADWTLLGQLCLNQPPIALGDACVSYYATPDASVPDLQREFAAFLTSLPTGMHAVLPR